MEALKKKYSIGISAGNFKKIEMEAERLWVSKNSVVQIIIMEWTPLQNLPEATLKFLKKRKWKWKYIKTSFSFPQQTIQKLKEKAELSHMRPATYINALLSSFGYIYIK